MAFLDNRNISDAVVLWLKKKDGSIYNADIKYAIACAKRDMIYSNRALTESLGWRDKSTLEYINNF